PGRLGIRTRRAIAAPATAGADPLAVRARRDPRGGAGARGLPAAAHGRIGGRAVAAGPGWTQRVRRGRCSEARGGAARPQAAGGGGAAPGRPLPVLPGPRVRGGAGAGGRSLGGALKSDGKYCSICFRGRNRIIGAKLSEHGKANALDIRSFKLVNGTVVELTDPTVAKDFRERLRKDTCARFSTLLGPGSDGYHENHVHVDLAERVGGHRMCQWEGREPGEEAAHVRLHGPRPASAAP